MSNTIQQLHDLVALSETQHAPDDRITGSEVRAVDTAIIGEVARRGLLVAESLADIVAISKDETGGIIIPNIGIFFAHQTPDPADNIRTFPSPVSGWLWKNATPFGELIAWVQNNFTPLTSAPPPPPPPPF